MKSVLVALLLFLVLSINGYAQPDSLPQKRLEVFLNISNSLARFTGNNSDGIILDAPFLIGMKLRNKKGTGAWRFGTDFNLIDNTGNTNGIFSETREQYLSGNFGYEWRRKTMSKFEVYGGIEARYFEITRETNTFSGLGGSSGTQNSVFYTRNNGPGAALFLGFSFNITPRISFFTEGSLAYYALNNFRSFKVAGSPFTEVLEVRLIHQFRPIAPNSIFFSYRF